MERLDKLDVVIRVDRELPKPDIHATENIHYCAGYHTGRGHLIDAGYVAIERLIE